MELKGFHECPPVPVNASQSLTTTQSQLRLATFVNVPSLK